MCKCHGSRNEKKAVGLAVYPADVLLFIPDGITVAVHLVWYGPVTGLLLKYMSQMKTSQISE